METTYTKEGKVLPKKKIIGIFMTIILALACFIGYKQLTFVNRVHKMISIQEVKEEKESNGSYKLTLNYKIPKESELQKIYPYFHYVFIPFDKNKNEWFFDPNTSNYYTKDQNGKAHRLTNSEYYKFANGGEMIVPFVSSGTLIFDFKTKEEMEKTKKVMLSANSWSNFLTQAENTDN